jgi:hypothetical protein
MGKFGLPEGLFLSNFSLNKFDYLLYFKVNFVYWAAFSSFVHSIYIYLLRVYYGSTRSIGSSCAIPCNAEFVYQFSYM